VLDLKQPAGVEAAQALADRCDVLVENFATGVMDRLGLGAEALQARNPGLIYVSASGLGRSGPEAHAVAYGTLLQCYAGFAGLNRHPDRPPRVGMAWLDPMCGLMLAFAAAAALWARRRNGVVARVDFSMIEAMLWTMADPLLAAQSGDAPQPRGNADRTCAPHGVYRCAGEDAWIALAVRDQTEWRRLCEAVPVLSPLKGADPHAERARIDRAIAAWCGGRSASDALATLQASGVPTSILADSADLVASPHLRARGFWELHGDGVLPGLPWQASIGRRSGPAPRLGADTDNTLKSALGISDETIVALRRQGAFG
jgi:crotonobetainyl-CoA:carnitine CoA-transferase CaiB-like acyl-CoA transferase